MSVAMAIMRANERRCAQAMLGEFEEAERDGHGLTFALGCLFAAAQRLMCSSAGWHCLSRYVFAVALVLPFAAFHLGCAWRGGQYLLFGNDPYLAALSAGSGGQRAIAEAYRTWAPLLVLLLAALGAVHLVTAWRIVASEWRRVVNSMIAGAAIIAGLLLCVIAIHPTIPGLLLQCAAWAAELLVVPILAAWQTRRADSFVT